MFLPTVRSLTMDKWPEGTLRYMKSVGNKKANEFWEARLDPAVTPRLRPNSTQQERTEFITAKYEKRKFCEECPFANRSQINDALFQSVHEIDFGTVMPLKSGSSDSPFGTPALLRRETIDLSGGSGDSQVLRSSSSTVISPRKEVLLHNVGVAGDRSSSEVSNAGSRRRSDSYSNEPLHASLVLDSEKVQELIWPMYKWLAWGAELNALHPDSKRSIGQVLLEKRDPWLLHLFLVHGVEVAQVEEDTGDSLLHFAARHNLFECLDVLFTHLGSLAVPSIHVKNIAGQSPLEVARACGSLRVLEFFMSRDAKPIKTTESSVDEQSPRTTMSVSTDNGFPEEVKRSPRAPYLSSDSMDERGESGMQKFLKKATGGHLRSKSVFQGATGNALNASGPIRDPVAQQKVVLFCFFLCPFVVCFFFLFFFFVKYFFFFVFFFLLLFVRF